MTSLKAKALTSFLKKLVIVSLLIFVSAWSLAFWEAWVFLVVFFIPQLLMIIYFSRTDPDLLERRLKGRLFAENRTRQKIIMSLISLFFVFTVFVSGLDHRLNWSHVPTFLVVAADVAVVLGFIIQFDTFKQNSFASAVVEIAAKQEVISTGSYAVVRHPMYAGALVVDFFLPIALGSWWGVLFVLVILVLIILRLFDEEKLLVLSLPGYEAYCQRVKYRLIPNFW
jgi:protein-S-isoprenylcysteine O-methyltransferase Ste14